MVPPWNLQSVRRVGLQPVGPREVRRSGQGVGNWAWLSLVAVLNRAPCPESGVLTVSQHAELSLEIGAQ